MKIIKKSAKRKVIISLLVGTVLFIGGSAFAYQHFRNKDTAQTGQSGVNQVNYGPPKKEDSAQTSSSKDDVANSPASPAGKPDEPVPQQTSVSATITQAMQQDNMIVIRALVNGANSGTCQLTLSQNGQTTITRSAAVGVQATYAICQGFDIPVSDLPSAGSWTASIVIQTSSGVSPAAQRSIQVTK